MGFVGVELTLLTSFHGMNAIMKQGRPKVTGSDNILSSGYAERWPPHAPLWQSFRTLSASSIVRH
jgi:hypothetical protein